MGRRNDHVLALLTHGAPENYQRRQVKIHVASDHMHRILEPLILTQCQPNINFLAILVPVPSNRFTPAEARDDCHNLGSLLREDKTS